MKRESNPMPENLTLDKINRKFFTDNKARKYLESIRWANGIECVHCKNNNAKKIWKLAANPQKKIRPGLYHCSFCNKQFTVTIGTIFEDTRIPLRKWLIAWYMVCSSKKGVSSLQLQRQLALGSYRTALFMTHRIRHALKDSIFTEKDKLEGVVEVDETYIGGKRKRIRRSKKSQKIPVVAMVERGGRVRSKVVPRVTAESLRQTLIENVKINAVLFTDDFKGYLKPAKDFYIHQSVNHSVGEYVRGDIHTNTVEGFFSILKRGINGIFHSVSKKHLHYYLNEFDFRYSERHVTDGERTVRALRKMEGKRLTWEQLVAPDPILCDRHVSQV